MSQQVMKAKKIAIEELKEWPDYQIRKWVVERKIDGFRYTRLKGKWLSKQGKRFFNVREIQKELDNCRRLNGYIIDGELAGKTWQQTMTLFRSSKADVSQGIADGKFWIFDIVDPNMLHEPWIDRNQRLMETVLRIQHPNIAVVPSHSLLSFDGFEQRHNDHLAMGCDGSILKSRYGGYEFKRSKLWLKVKPIHEVDCKIVGFKEGKGKYRGTLGSLLVRVPIPKHKWSNHVTGVSGMTDEDRHYIWKHQDKLLNTIVEVKYRTISEKDRLVEGRIHRLRPDKTCTEK